MTYTTLTHHTHITHTPHTQDTHTSHSLHLRQTHGCPIAHTPPRIKNTAWHVGQVFTTCLLTLGGGAKCVTYIQVDKLSPRLYLAYNSSVANTKSTLWATLQRRRKLLVLITILCYIHVQIGTGTANLDDAHQYKTIAITMLHV